MDSDALCDRTGCRIVCSVVWALSFIPAGLTALVVYTLILLTNASVAPSWTVLISVTSATLLHFGLPATLRYCFTLWRLADNLVHRSLGSHINLKLETGEPGLNRTLDRFSYNRYFWLAVSMSVFGDFGVSVVAGKMAYRWLHKTAACRTAACLAMLFPVNGVLRLKWLSDPETVRLCYFHHSVSHLLNLLFRLSLVSLDSSARHECLPFLLPAHWWQYVYMGFSDVTTMLMFAPASVWHTPTLVIFTSSYYILLNYLQMSWDGLHGPEYTKLLLLYSLTVVSTGMAYQCIRYRVAFSLLQQSVLDLVAARREQSEAARGEQPS